MNVRAVWPLHAPFRPSSSRVKVFNGDRASRADGLLLADLPNGHTAHTAHMGEESVFLEVAETKSKLNRNFH